MSLHLRFFLRVAQIPRPVRVGWSAGITDRKVHPELLQKPTPWPGSVRLLTTKDTSAGSASKPTDTEDDGISIPDPPTTCCMSGCANCVWIEYAQELASLYRDGGKAAEKVTKTIEDPSLKIFLSIELKEKLKSEEH